MSMILAPTDTYVVTARWHIPSGFDATHDPTAHTLTANDFTDHKPDGLTIDLAKDQFILLDRQPNAYENGIYYPTQKGNGIDTPLVLKRVLTLDEDHELLHDTLVCVGGGERHLGEWFRIHITADPFVLETSALAFLPQGPHIALLQSDLYMPKRLVADFAATSELAGTYNPAAHSITASSLGVYAPDGTNLVGGERVLLPYQSNKEENGYYLVYQPGDASNPAVLIRPPTYRDETEIIPGDAVDVMWGATQARSKWVIDGAALFTAIGEDEITYLRWY